MSVFKYSRKKTVNKVDENGKVIPLKTVNEEGVEEVVPGKFETREIWLEDYFNLDLLIRTHALENGNVIVLLNDGHEISERVPVLKNKRRPPTPDNISEERIRQWVQSELLIEKPEDVQRLYEALDKL